MTKTNKSSISIVIIARNEEKNIVDCIEGLSWVDEIIVIDDNSEDRTREIAEKNGASVFVHSLNDNFSDQRNFGLEKATGEWVLFLDADERISKKLKEEIRTIINDPNQLTDGFLIQRRDILWGRELRYGEVGNIILLRLARRSNGVWGGAVHEKWNVKGIIGTLKNPIIHYPHQDIDEFIKEINFYTSIRAHELYREKQHSSWISILVYTKAKFLKGYFLELGFLDGIPGFIHALLMCFHSFLVRVKLWQLWQKD